MSTVLKIDEKASGNVFVDSEAHGNVDVAGQGNSFIRFKFSSIKKHHPVLFWVSLLAAIATIVGVIVDVVRTLLTK